MTAPASVERAQFRHSRYLFWAALLLATISSLLLGADPNAGAGPALAASFIMFLYLLASWLWTPAVIKEPDYADGFYYLGFLLTLVALVATLVSLGSVPDAEVQRVVLARFGLALATTIVGLGIRTGLRMFLQARSESLTDVLARAQEEVRRASESLRLVLQNAATDMETTLGSAASRIDSSSGALASRIASVTEGLATVSARLTPLAEAFQSAEARATTFVEELRTALAGWQDDVVNAGAAVSNLAGATNAGAQALGTLADSVGAVAEAGRQLAERLASARRGLEELETISGRLGEFDQLAGKMNRLGQEVDTGRAVFQRITSSLTTLEATLEGYRTRADPGAFDSLAQLTEVIRRQMDGVRQSVSDWEGALTQLSALTRRLGERETEAAESLLNVEKELTSGVQFLRRLASQRDA